MSRMRHCVAIASVRSTYGILLVYCSCHRSRWCDKLHTLTLFVCCFCIILKWGYRRKCGQNTRTKMKMKMEIIKATTITHCSGRIKNATKIPFEQISISHEAQCLIQNRPTTQHSVSIANKVPKRSETNLKSNAKKASWSKLLCNSFFLSCFKGTSQKSWLTEWHTKESIAVQIPLWSYAFFSALFTLQWLGASERRVYDWDDCFRLEQHDNKNKWKRTTGLKIAVAIPFMWKRCECEFRLPGSKLNLKQQL